VSTITSRSSSTAQRQSEAHSGSIVVIGFEPFDGRTRNRSWEVVRRLPARPGLETVRLPVNFAELENAVPALAERKPRALLLVGESSTGAVSVEQLALNIVDTDTPDNAGRSPQAEAIVTDGPLALRARWDARTVARRLNAIGIPAVASFHAGTYACNFALYLALRAFPEHTPVGFLHLPQRRRTFGLRPADLLRAVELGVAALGAQQR
jgi:pyroglutamyl-peptidase